MRTAARAVDNCVLGRRRTEPVERPCRSEHRDATVGRMKPLTDHCIHTENDLEALWRDLMNPLGFTERALNVVLIAGTQALPGLLVIGDLPEHTDELDEHGFAEWLGAVRDECQMDRISVLVSRPGVGSPGPADLAWVRLVRAAAARADLPTGLTYVANDAELRPIRLDDAL